MTVIVSKPAVNLREELASLRNQGGYQEQQFYFDGLVTNGTFDADTSGWTGTNATLSVVGGAIRASAAGVNPVLKPAVQWNLTAGKSYQLRFNIISVNTGGLTFYNYAAGNLAMTGNGANVAAAGLYEYSFVAPSSGGHNMFFQNWSGTTYFDVDNISVFETDGTDVVHRMPKGWVPKDVYEDGLLQREGAAHDYEVVYDGFDYFVKPTVAPSATTQTCVIGVKA